MGAALSLRRNRSPSFLWGRASARAIAEAVRIFLRNRSGCGKRTETSPALPRFDSFVSLSFSNIHNHISERRYNSACFLPNSLCRASYRLSGCAAARTNEYVRRRIAYRYDRELLGEGKRHGSEPLSPCFFPHGRRSSFPPFTQPDDAIQKTAPHQYTVRGRCRYSCKRTACGDIKRSIPPRSPARARFDARLTPDAARGGRFRT